MHTVFKHHSCSTMTETVAVCSPVGHRAGIKNGLDDRAVLKEFLSDQNPFAVDGMRGFSHGNSFKI
jgi:hypothetical protein